MSSKGKLFPFRFGRALNESAGLHAAMQRDIAPNGRQVKK